jgi:hypothetical protein
MSALRSGAGMALAGLLGMLAVAPVHLDAHKPITSPYTYNEDVFPIVRDRCGRCHVDGGVAPMALLTQQDAVPWGESIRTELIAGHMPPWRVESAASRFRGAAGLTARELNILMTWVTGGTPLGAPARTPPVQELQRTWRGGTPDLVLQPDAAFALAANRQEDTSEFVLRTDFPDTRWLRAIDLLPGTPAIVRSATIAIIPPNGDRSPDDGTQAVTTERLIALWLPGDDPAPLDAGAGFELPPGAGLRVRVHYRKTWTYEHTAMSDRSQVGLYFAAPPAATVRMLTVAGAAGTAARQDQTIAFSQTIDHDLRALAIYPDVRLEQAGVQVDAVRPDGSREALIAFHPESAWQRRYWFAEPIVLPRGTRIDVRATFNDTAALLPPGATPIPPQEPDPARVRLTLDVVEH